MVLAAAHHAGWSPLATFTVASTERYQQNGEGEGRRHQLGPL